MALEILKERGHQFSNQQETLVQKIVQEKKAEIAEATEENEIWEDYTTDDPNAIKLYPLAYIVVLSTLFGTIPGALLLALNFMKIKKYTSVIFVLLFGLIYPLFNIIYWVQFQHLMRIKCIHAIALKHLS